MSTNGITILLSVYCNSYGTIFFGDEVGMPWTVTASPTSSCCPGSTQTGKGSYICANFGCWWSGCCLSSMHMYIDRGTVNLAWKSDIVATKSECGNFVMHICTRSGLVVPVEADGKLSAHLMCE